MSVLTSLIESVYILVPHGESGHAQAKCFVIAFEGIILQIFSKFSR